MVRVKQWTEPCQRISSSAGTYGGSGEAGQGGGEGGECWHLGLDWYLLLSSHIPYPQCR